MLTLLSNVPGIGQVRFSVLGVDQSVLRDDFRGSGETVSREDYLTLLASG
ncbi:MAG: hypothetical protein R2715_13880 [Ilumatobacteraceae bacterium]